MIYNDCFRLQSLEKRVYVESGDTPPIVYDMKHKVENFREKLEVIHLFMLDDNYFV